MSRFNLIWVFMLDYLLTVLALVLVIEGLLPAVSPHTWRKMMFKLMQYNENSIRRFGLGCMLAGAVLMYLIHQNIL